MANDNRTGQFSLIAPFLTQYIQGWLPQEDGIRVAAYDYYDDLYWNDVGGYKLTLRGDEEFPVYIPSARRLINTFDRYVARGAKLALLASSDSETEAGKLAYSSLFARERFWTTFRTQKRKGSTRGDWVLMISANPDKPEGRRISIHAVHPGKYFVINNPENSEDRWGASIMELITIGDKDYIRRQRWLKPVHPEHPQAGNLEAEIAYESIIFETENFNDDTKRKVFRQDIALDVLPGIFSVPLYHFRAGGETDAVYGSTDLRGLERIILAVNQAATDQDVTLAMAGLGMYVSDSTPVDNDGNRTDWILGPKRVVEIPPDGKFDRVSGVPTVAPSIQHMEWIQRQAESVHGINSVALGDLDEVGVAESGIALALRMAPLIDAAEDREFEITDVMNQMLFDLRAFFEIYEGIRLPTTDVRVIYGDKLPLDRTAKETRLQQLYTDRVVSLEWYWEELQKLGYDIKPAEMRSQLIADEEIHDPAGARLQAEADAAPDDEGAQIDEE